MLIKRSSSLNAYSASSVRCLDATHEAFSKAVEIFNSKITKDVKKKAAIQDVTTLEDVRGMVLEAKAQYEKAHEHLKTSKWLLKFSNRVIFYGNILDVVVQQHPEYVSLVWGTMKFLFVVSKFENGLVGAKDS